MLAHVFTNLGQIFALCDLPSNEVNDLLRGEAVPDAYVTVRSYRAEGKNRTIAGNNQEFILCTDIVDSNIWIRSDNLLLRGHGVIFLEIKVSKCS